MILPLLVFAAVVVTPHHKAPKSVPTTAAASSPAIDPNKFDLICQVQSVLRGGSGTPIHFRINLTDSTWCDERNCQVMKPIIKVLEEKIQLEASISSTPLGVETYFQSVDRITGRWHAEHMFGGRIDDRLEGDCERLAYMSPSKRAF